MKQSNKRGNITFATSGPNSRTTQVFINFKDNAGPDGQGFAPFGQVITGMDVVDKLHPATAKARRAGAAGAGTRAGGRQRVPQKDFPQLDFIKKATIEP